MIPSCFFQNYTSKVAGNAIFSTIAHIWLIHFEETKATFFDIIVQYLIYKLEKEAEGKDASDNLIQPQHLRWLVD